jgi:hypothetical protein
MAVVQSFPSYAGCVATRRLIHHDAIAGALLGLVWFHHLSVIFSPPLQPDTFQPLQSIFAGGSAFINPVTLALFSLVGISYSGF